MWAIALAASTLPSIKLSVDQFAGMTLSVNGVPVIVGSSFNYLDPKSGRTVYSSRWSPKQVSQLPNGATQVRFSGDNGNVIGTHTYTLTAKGVQVRYEFRWRGAQEARIDHCLAQIWAPAVSHGQVQIDDLDLSSVVKPLQGDWDTRRLGAGGRFRFEAPFLTATMRLKNSRAALHDARAYGQDWAKGNSLFWIGQKGLTVRPNQTTEVVAEWEFETNAVAPAADQTAKLSGAALSNALTPSTRIWTGITPKSYIKSDGRAWLFGDGMPTELSHELGKRLADRWDVNPSEVTLPIVSERASTLRPEEFQTTVSPDKVVVRHNGEAGLAHAIDSLALSATVEGGRLALPCGTTSDWPSVTWRGVHVFAGPDSPAFLSDYARRVLGPMRFNRAVVESSRAQWKGVDPEKARNWISLEGLKSVFSTLREQHIEPIPLVQSLGHMEWLLDGSNRSYAVSSDLPYTLDYRRKAAKDLIKSVWQELFDVLKPETVHLGMDEIAMRGATSDTTLPRRLWESSLKELAPLARQNGADIMLWGDMMLSPGEAVDATHSKSKEEAQAFRASVPKGATVADWHYQPGAYPSLSLWQTLGLKPVATSWYRTENILSHTQAALKVGAGTLQTTWAGYSTNERAALLETQQFAAHLVAANASWTGSTTPLPNPMSVLRDLLWSPQYPLSPRNGQGWTEVVPSSGDSVKVGSFRFLQLENRGLFSPISSQSSHDPLTLTLKLATRLRRVALAVECVAWQKEADPVARIVFVTDRGDKVRDVLYGADVRAPEDTRDTVRTERKDGLSAVWADFGEDVELREIRVESTSLTAGLRVMGITTI